MPAKLVAGIGVGMGVVLTCKGWPENHVIRHLANFLDYPYWIHYCIKNGVQDYPRRENFNTSKSFIFSIFYEIKQHTILTQSGLKSHELYTL